MDEIDVEELSRALQGGDIAIVDVREPWEFELCSLPGSIHIPLQELPSRFIALDRAARTVVVCHHGMRSQAAQGFLLAQGFTRVENLLGGIAEWAARIDPAMARY